MFRMKGTDNYTDHFDFFKWSAPVYETPKEVVEALNQIDFNNKKIEQIRCIGTAEVVGFRSHRLYDAIKNAGIEPEDGWWEKYPHLSKMPIERKVRLCEPIQIVFSDGSTFEFMPMEGGGARFSQNSIPLNVANGINKNNIDLGAFFGNQVKSREIESCRMRVHRNEKEYYDYPYCMDKDKPYTETRTQNGYVFSLGYPYSIVVEMGWESYFTVELDHQNGCDTIPYGEAQECVWPVKQIYITAGRDGGGTFWIIPTHSDDRPYKKEHNISDYDNCGMSVDDSYIYEFVIEFLYKYFDQSIQDEDHDRDGFDGYGGNLYSRESMEKIVEEIRETVSLLQTDFDNPMLGEIKKNFSPYTFSPETSGKLSEKKKNELYQKNIDLAIDFYIRFADRIESMLVEQPDCNVISFAGP